MPSSVDQHGIPLRGSALHIAYYVNCEPETLTAAVLGSGSDASIEWRSPLAKHGFAEHKDRNFLAAVDRAGLADELSNWWPDSGPRWDALGVATETGDVILVEAKANVPEIANGPACGSGSSGSKQGLANLQKIEHALAATREHFGVSHDAAASWISSHRYQYANRLAHLCFFERLKVPARLANVYFTGDTTHIDTMSAEFEKQRESDAAAMGLSTVSIGSMTSAYLPARSDPHAKLHSHIEAKLLGHIT